MEKLAMKQYSQNIAKVILKKTIFYLVLALTD